MPILSALRRHKAGALLIALQIALTLAIVCNAVYIIHTRIERIHRPSGVDENQLMVVTNDWVGADTSSAAGKTLLDTRVSTDLAKLRQLPDVADAYSTNTLPLMENNWTGGLALEPSAKLSSRSLKRCAYFMGDTHALDTLGLKLVAGRNFRADEITPKGIGDRHDPPVIIISQALAKQLFPDGQAVGKAVYVNGLATPSTVIGVVERLQSSSVSSWGSSFAWSTVLLPVRYVSDEVNYVVRVKPGRMQAALREVPKALFATDRMRVISDGDVRTFEQVRRDAYRSDRGMAIMMTVISAILLAVTGAGIVGLSSFWVGQRRRQIGVRRALGATRNDILSYFLTENLLIAGMGVCVGAMLAVGLSLWLGTHFELTRMPASYVLAGVGVLLVIGQAAVLGPALRAASIPPVEATRTV